jgi:hypothetical protein
MLLEEWQEMLALAARVAGEELGKKFDLLEQHGPLYIMVLRSNESAAMFDARPRASSRLFARRDR